MILFGTTFLIIISSIVGITKLQVENSFINYFDKETEIYKGMKKIDDELGGTTPTRDYIKISSKQKDLKDDQFSEWEEDIGKMKINQNIGLLEIKWTKFLKFMTT